MMIHVNGEPIEVADDTMLGALIDTRVADRRGVAVAVDGEVVARSDWDTTTLDGAARVEIVGAVQGG